MTQYYTPTSISVMVAAEIQKLVGDTIGQLEFFSAHVLHDFRYPDKDKGEEAGEHFVLVRYHTVEMRIGLRFSLVDSTDKNILAVGGQWLYDGDFDYADLQNRMGIHMRDRVGDTIVAFLEENKPSNAVATE